MNILEAEIMRKQCLHELRVGIFSAVTATEKAVSSAKSSSSTALQYLALIFIVVITLERVFLKPWKPPFQSRAPAVGVVLRVGAVISSRRRGWMRDYPLSYTLDTRSCEKQNQSCSHCLLLMMAHLFSILNTLTMG